MSSNFSFALGEFLYFTSNKALQTKLNVLSRSLVICLLERKREIDLMWEKYSRLVLKCKNLNLFFKDKNCCKDRQPDN